MSITNFTMPPSSPYSDSKDASLRGEEESCAPLLVQDYSQNDSGRRRSWHFPTMIRYLVAFGAVSLAILALFFATYSLARRTSSVTTHIHLPDEHFCGNTTQEARSRNCHYEPLLSCWVPDACYTSEPSEGFDPYSELRWFSDPDLTQPLNEREIEGMRTGEFNIVWTDWQYHHHHCIYLWRKLAVAVENRIPFTDTRTAEFAHSLHCASTITEYVRGEKAFTMDGDKSLLVEVKALGCVALF